MIKDSGNRRTFDTGAVRDIQEGKGRCDLLPLGVVAEFIQDPILEALSEFQITGATSYLYTALDHFGVTREWDNMTMILEVSIHFEEGALKYGENNWQKGLPLSCYLDSAVRHYLKWRRGDLDEPHDRAFVWNVLCCAWEVTHTQTSEEVSSNEVSSL